MTSNPSKQPSAHVTEARAAAQRAKLDAQAERRRVAKETATKAKQAKGKDKQSALLSKRRASTTMERAIADYLLDHEGGNSSQKTLQWHQTALGLLRSFLQEERGITLVGEVDAPDINAWFASLRKTPSSRGKIRCERTSQTYARSARAFFHWLVRRETIERSPFDRVVFPKVGKPLIRTIESEEFERLLVACTPALGIHAPEIGIQDGRHHVPHGPREIPHVHSRPLARKLLGSPSVRRSTCSPST